MTIIRRMAAGYAGALLMLVALGGVVTAMWLWFEGRYVEASEGTNEQIIAASKITESSAPMGPTIQAAVLTQDESMRSLLEASFEADYEATREAIAALTAMETEDDDQDDLAALEDLVTLLDDYHKIAAVAILDASANRTAALSVLDGQVLPAGVKFEETVRAYANAQIEEAATTISSIRTTGHVALLVNLVVLAVGVVLGVVFVVLIIRSISRRLRGATSGLGNSASELMNVASQVSASAAQTAASASETAATVEEARQAAILASEKAAEVADSGETVTRLAESGQAAMEDTLVEIELMQQQMSAIAETVTRLGGQTDEVQEVIATVNDLAEQSNLLSVNASIEAAKAGEYGRGFTVVAQEVKSLAEQSKKAVTQVRRILGEIQSSTGAAAREAETGREAMRTAGQKSHEASEIVRAMAESVAAGARQAGEQILASSQQQLAGMEQIGQAIKSINQAGEQSAAGTRRMEEEVKRLQVLAANLRQIVDRQANEGSNAVA